MAAKKITKHQMKEDKLVTAMFKFWEWAGLHTKQLWIASGAVVILILVVYLYATSQAGRTKQAAELFGQAVIEMQTPVAGQMQAAVTDFQQLLQGFPKSKWSPYACFYLADLLYQDGQYAKAQGYFQKYLKEYGDDSLMTASAYGGLAECSEHEKDYMSAGEYYLKGAEVHPGSILAPAYLLQAGKAYRKADMKQKAVEIYQRLLRDYPKSSSTDPARQEIAQIAAS